MNIYTEHSEVGYWQHCQSYVNNMSGVSALPVASNNIDEIDSRRTN